MTREDELNDRHTTLRREDSASDTQPGLEPGLTLSKEQIFKSDGPVWKQECKTVDNTYNLFL